MAAWGRDRRWGWELGLREYHESQSRSNGLSKCKMWGGLFVTCYLGFVRGRLAASLTSFGTKAGGKDEARAMSTHMANTHEDGDG